MQWPEKADMARSCSFKQNSKYGMIFEKWPDILDTARLKMTRRTRRRTTFQLRGPRLRWRLTLINQSL